MASFDYLFALAPPTLSAAESAAYEARRNRCLWVLDMMAADIADYEPDEYLLALYRGYISGRWSYDYISEALQTLYQQIVAGNRSGLPSDRLSDPDKHYCQAGEGFAQQLLSATYRVWRRAYVPPPSPIYGPHPVGHEVTQPAAHVFSRAERAELVHQACQLLSDEQRARWQARASQVLPTPLFELTPTAFEREVLSSYLAREISEHTARQLLATHGESPQHKNDWLQ